MTGKVIIFRRDRLGARLRNIIAGIRLHDMFGAELVVAWPVGHYSQELRRPRDLFERRFILDHFVTKDPDIEALLAGATPFKKFPSVDEMRTHLDTGKDILIEDIGEQVRLPGEPPENASAAFVAAAAAVPINKTVQARLELFDAFCGGQKVTALHVRRGDIIYDPRWAKDYWPTKYVPDEYYDAMIEPQSPSAYVLFSDTTASVARFRDVHGIQSAADIMQLQDLDQAQADLCELLAIARCTSVLSGSHSAFSSAATMIGGARKIALPDDMPDDLRLAAEIQLRDRVGKGAGAFLNEHDFGQCAHWVVDTHIAAGDDKAAQAVRLSAITGDNWIPHLGTDAFMEALNGGDDAAVLDMLRRGERFTVFLRSHIKKPARMRNHTRRLFSTARAYTGLGQLDQGAAWLYRAALLQNPTNRLDLLSVPLAQELSAGTDDCPPTTLVPYGAAQLKEPVFGKLKQQQKSLIERFLQDDTPYNWQAAFFLDWRHLCFLDAFTPAPSALDQIVEVGRDGNAMQASLAALACLYRGDRGHARRLMAKAADARDTVTGTDAALLAKRRAHLALARNQNQAAEAHMEEAFGQSDHASLQVWWAVADSERGLTQQAIDRLEAIEDAPPYAKFWLLRLKERNDIGSRPERKALQSEFESTMAIGRSSAITAEAS